MGDSKGRTASPLTYARLDRLSSSKRGLSIAWILSRTSSKLLIPRFIGGKEVSDVANVRESRRSPIRRRDCVSCCLYRALDVRDRGSDGRMGGIEKVGCEISHWPMMVLSFSRETAIVTVSCQSASISYAPTIGVDGW